MVTMSAVMVWCLLEALEALTAIYTGILSMTLGEIILRRMAL